VAAGRVPWVAGSSVLADDAAQQAAGPDQVPERGSYHFADDSAALAPADTLVPMPPGHVHNDVSGRVAGC
jgi:hypothetical protein